MNTAKKEAMAREQFEAWWKSEHHNMGAVGSWHGTGYNNVSIDAAWNAWKLAALSRGGDERRQWLEVRGLAAAIVKKLESFAAGPHRESWCGALDDSLMFADQIEKGAAAAYRATFSRPAADAVPDGVLRRARDLFDQDREYARERGDNHHAGRCTKDIAAIDAAMLAANRFLVNWS